MLFKILYLLHLRLPALNFLILIHSIYQKSKQLRQLCRKQNNLEQKKTHLTESDELIYFKPARPAIIN